MTLTYWLTLEIFPPCSKKNCSRLHKAVQVNNHKHMHWIWVLRLSWANSGLTSQNRKHSWTLFCLQLSSLAKAVHQPQKIFTAPTSINLTISLGFLMLWPTLNASSSSAVSWWQDIPSHPKLDVLFSPHEGAGISVYAGIPDFRSEGGIFQTSKKEFKLQSGKDLFDIDMISKVSYT